jgi:hypothetical protein
VNRHKFWSSYFPAFIIAAFVIACVFFLLWFITELIVIVQIVSLLVE